MNRAIATPPLSISEPVTQAVKTRALGIQTLHAIAASMVVIAHSPPLAAHLSGTLIDAHIGGAGVDIFFVISGYIMAKIALLKPLSPANAWEFAKKRIARIVPIYWLITILAAAGLLLAGEGVDFWGFVTSLAFIPYRFASPDVDAPIILAGWTLNYEMFFYALVALIVALKPSRPVLTISAVLIGLVSLHGLFRPDQYLLRHYTSPMLLEFLGGILIAKLAIRRSFPPLMGVAAILLGCMALAVTQSRPWMSHGHPVYILASIAIVQGVVVLENVITWPRFATLRGDASYSLYLIHAYILTALAAVAGLVPDVTDGCGASVASQSAS